MKEIARSWKSAKSLPFSESNTCAACFATATWHASLAPAGGPGRARRACRGLDLGAARSPGHALLGRSRRHWTGWRLPLRSVRDRRRGCHHPRAPATGLESAAGQWDVARSIAPPGRPPRRDCVRTAARDSVPLRHGHSRRIDGRCTRWCATRRTSLEPGLGVAVRNLTRGSGGEVSLLPPAGQTETLPAAIQPPTNELKRL